MRPVLPLLALAACGLAACDGGDVFTRGVTRAPVVQIVPGVSAPSAPVVTVLRTRKVNPPAPDTSPDVMDEAPDVTGPAPAPAPTPAPVMAPTPLSPQR